MSAFVHFWAFKVDAGGCTGTRIPADVSAEPFGLRQRNRTLFGAARAPPRRFCLRLRRSAATVPWLRGTTRSSSACCCWCYCCCILTVRSCPAQEIVCDLFNFSYHQCYESGSAIRCLFDPIDPGSGMGKKSLSRMNNPNHISESLETVFWVKILKFSDADPKWKNSDPG